MIGRGLLAHLRISLRLNARNRMALLYAYLFPIIFLVSFLVLYRTEDPLLMRHMGELLTVTVLGGACFGLPTALVSERERGVWRRYRLTPVSTGALVASTLVARYIAVLGAVLFQLAVAMAIGRWLPAHPLDLWVAYTLVAFALLGLGLVVTALADNVPAVQALGQCLFLPMLIIGGVAVRLESLPSWLLPVTAFFPGRYAVESLQATVNGEGVSRVGFQLLALLLIGACSFVAGAKLFRWDKGGRFLSLQHKSWVGVAVVSWAVVGAVAIARGELMPKRGTGAAFIPAAVNVIDPAHEVTQPVEPPTSGPQTAPGQTPPPVASSASAAPATQTATAATAPSAAGARALSTSPAPNAAEPWRALTAFDFAALPIDQIPTDDGNISPIASEDQTPAGESIAQLKRLEQLLATWPPGHVADRVQRVRNYLLLLGVADYAQSPLERFLPALVLGQMLEEFPREELAQLTCWVALHSDEGDLSAMKHPLVVELGSENLDPGEVRTRTYYYGVKFTRRLIGW